MSSTGKGERRTAVGERIAMSKELSEGVLLARRFRLARHIGRGAAGSVWLAEDTHLDGAPVACKILHEVLTDDRRALADFKREVLLSRRLRHPHLVATHTFWEDDGRCFITMEYVDGPNLNAMLAEREQPFALDEVLRWTAQLCAALDYAHENGILHRDVKPANILLAPDGNVRLADFGIARTAREARSRISGRLTSGTVMFMSPEQLMGEPLDPRTDLYSLAASLYKLLSGAPPFYQGALVTQIQMKSPSPIEGLPSGINEVLFRALAKRPEDRYATCGAFYDVLSAAAETARPTHETKFAVPRTVLRKRNEDEEQTVQLNSPAPKWHRVRLGLLLLNDGLITQRQLEESLDAQARNGKRLGEILVELGHVEETDIARALAVELNMPFATLADEQIQMAVAHAITERVALQRKCLPLRWEEGRVVVVMTDPLDLMTTADLEETYDAEISVRIVTETDLVETIRRVYQQA